MEKLLILYRRFESATYERAFIDEQVNIIAIFVDDIPALNTHPKPPPSP